MIHFGLSKLCWILFTGFPRLTEPSSVPDFHGKTFTEMSRVLQNVRGAERCRSQVGKLSLPLLLLTNDFSLLGSAWVLTPSLEQASHLVVSTCVFLICSQVYRDPGRECSSTLPASSTAYLLALLPSAHCELIKWAYLTSQPSLFSQLPNEQLPLLVSNWSRTYPPLLGWFPILHLWQTWLSEHLPLGVRWWAHRILITTISQEGYIHQSECTGA